MAIVRYKAFCNNMTTDSHQSAALDLVRQAIAEDNKQNYQEAYQLYKSAIATMLRALKCKLYSAETNPRLKSLLEKKTSDWLARAEELDKLAKQQYIPAENAEGRDSRDTSAAADPGNTYNPNTVLLPAYTRYQVAIKADQEQRYEEAYQIYIEVAQQLEYAMQCKPYADDMDPEMRQNCAENREGMLVRAEQIRIWLSQASPYA